MAELVRKMMRILSLHALFVSGSTSNFQDVYWVVLDHIASNKLWPHEGEGKRLSHQAKN